MEVVHLRENKSVTRWGLFFVSLALTAIIFAAIGFGVSNVVSVRRDVDHSLPAPQVTYTQAVSLPPTPITQSGESPFVAVVEKSYDAVVNISSNRRVQSRYHEMYDDFWRRFFKMPDREQVIPSFGSGFVVRDDGYIVTNNHVVDGGEDITVTLSDKSTHKATVVGADQPTDLAVLKIETNRRLQTVEFGNSSDMRVGDWVLAIGNPFPSLGLDRTVTVGVVSGKGRSQLSFGSETPIYQDYIQTDASINPGNSGGPLINLEGKVVGVNSAIASPSGGSVGIGFAIPSDLAKQIVSEIITEGKVARGYLGVLPRNLTTDEAEMVGLDRLMGVYIDEVTPGSPAAVGGLRNDDVISTFNGQEINGEQDFRLRVAAAKNGEEVKLGIIRRGKQQQVTVVLADREAALADYTPATPSTGNKPAESENVSSNWLGMTVADCSQELAYSMGVDYHEGAIVVSVDGRSPADVKGVVPGTIIVEIDYVPVKGKDDFEKVAKDIGNRDRAIAFHVFDVTGRIGYVAIKPQ